MSCARPPEIYRSFTSGWEGWFALPGGLLADPVPQGQLFFVVDFEGGRHPHYGRFLALEPNRSAELTWLTGEGGTNGAETVLSIEIEPLDDGSKVTLVHRGFYDQQAADHHGTSWSAILEALDQRLTSSIAP